MRLYRLLLSAAVGVLLLTGVCSAARITPIGGKVLDVKGAPVAGVKVIQIQVSDDVVPTATIRRETTSDNAGRFTLPEVEGTLADPKNQNADTALVAYEPGKWVGFKCLRDAKAEQKVFTITVSAPKSDTGKVTDIEGKPIEGAKVTPEYLSWDGDDGDCGCMPAEFVGQFVGMVPVVTDAQGNYRIGNIPSHMELSCQASKSGFAPKPYWMPEQKGDEDSIVLVPAGGASGRVVDSSEKGVKDVYVTVVSRNGSPDGSQVITADDGSFTLDSIVPGKFMLQLRKTGPNPSQRPSKTYVAKVGQTVQLPDVFLKDTVTVTGKVVDFNTGKPLVGANINAQGEDWSWNTDLVGTDGNGNYEIKVQPGKAQIEYSGGLKEYYSGDSFPSGYISIPPAGLKNLVIKARKMKTARGKVIDSSGRPVKGVEVAVAAGDSLDPVKTDAEGAFVISVPPIHEEASRYSRDGMGNMHIVVADDPAGKRGVSKTIDRETLLKKGIVLRVLPYKTLKVFVKDESGKPFEGVDVQVSERQGYRGYQKGDVTTDASGIVVIDKLCQGSKIEVWASKEGYSHMSSASGDYDLVVGGAGWTGEYTVTLTADSGSATSASKFTGRVVDQNDKPVAGAVVSTQTNIPYTGTTDATGSFVLHPGNSEYASSYDFNPPSAGVQEFTVVSADGSAAIVQNVDIDVLGAEGLLFKLRPTRTLRAKVVDNEGKPLAGASISIGRAVNRSSFSGDTSESVLTEANGEVTLRDLNPGGTYSISAKLAGYYFGYKELPRVGSAAWTDDFVVTMEKAQRVQKGRVVGPDGKPVAGAHVEVSIDGHPGATTNSKGEFVLKNLPNSSISLNVNKNRLYGWGEAANGVDKLVIKLRKES